jgi:E3 ubiquitin-protein ligase RNF13
MSKPHDHEDPEIPAVFVSQKAGLIMAKLLEIDIVRVRITPVSGIGQEAAVGSQGRLSS